LYDPQSVHVCSETLDGLSMTAKDAIVMAGTVATIAVESVVGSIISRDEASRIDRPQFPEPWAWSEPMQAMVQDSYSWTHPAQGPEIEWEDALLIMAKCIDNLYACGYAVIKLQDDT